jgi:TetR/AcrR family transcriptional regulator, cholesterol catabolism regulator
MLSYERVNMGAERPTTERVFDRAADLFWHKGFAATTTREIATAVGIQQASLYHHMASKEDLLYKICLSSLERFLGDVPSAVSAVAGPLDRIPVLVRAHLATLLRYQKRNVTLLRSPCGTAVAGPYHRAKWDSCSR